MKIETMYACYYGVYLKKAYYAADGSVAITAWNMSDGPIAHLTICLDDHTLEKDEAYLDVNNFPEVTEFVEKYHLAKITGKTRRSGYVTYPAVKFDMDEVKKYEYRQPKAVEDAV